MHLHGGEMNKLEEALYESALATVANNSDTYQTVFMNKRFVGLVDGAEVCTGITPTDTQKKLAMWLVNKKLTGE